MVVLGAGHEQLLISGKSEIGFTQTVTINHDIVADTEWDDENH